MPQKKRNENWCPICYKFCGYNIHKHSCYAKADQADKKKINEHNFQIRSDLYRNLFINPASDRFPQLDVFSREQVINLLTDLGHRVVPDRCYLNAPYRLSTAFVDPIMASSATMSDADSATVGAPPLGGPPSVAAGGPSGSAPSVSSSVSTRSGSSAAALGAPPLGDTMSVTVGAPPLGDTMSVTVGAPPSDIH